MTSRFDPQELDFLERLMESDGGDDAHLVYADWLEERGRHEEAAAHRWAWERQVVPNLSHSAPGYWWTLDGELAMGFNIYANYNRYPVGRGPRGYRNAFARLGQVLAAQKVGA
jgi:uncharacterized protein (TIGR02996 family)